MALILALAGGMRSLPGYGPPGCGFWRRHTLAGNGLPGKTARGSGHRKEEAYERRFF